MKPSTKRLLSLVVALLMVFAALVVYFNYTTTEYGVADQIRSDVAARQNLIGSQKDAINQVNKLIQDYTGTAQLREVVSLALPTAMDQSGVFYQVSSMATINKLFVQSFTISAPTTQNANSGASSTAIIRPISSITFQFRVIGAYADFKNFLSNLETNIRVFDVRSISINPLTVKQTQDFFGFDVTVVTYYQNS